MRGRGRADRGGGRADRLRDRDDHGLGSPTAEHLLPVDQPSAANSAMATANAMMLTRA